MGERVAEVEDRASSAVERVGETDAGLERGAAPHELGLRELPERLARQEARLDHLGHAFAPLPLRQRGEERRVEDRPDRPVEGADEVLPLRQVERRLAADRRVDLAEERRRDRDPVDPAEVRGRDEAGDVGRTASAESGDGAAAVERELPPEPLGRRDRLRLLARRHLVRRDHPRPERDLGSRAVDPGDARVGDERDGRLTRDERGEALERSSLDVDAGRGQDRVVGVTRTRVRDLAVEGRPLLVQATEVALVLRERTAGAPDALPGRVDVHVDEDGHGALPQRVPHRL